MRSWKKHVKLNNSKTTTTRLRDYGTRNLYTIRNNKS